MKAFKQNSWNGAPAVTYRIKENRKAIAILKIDDFLHVNSLLTLLIGVWSLFAGLPPPDFMRVRTNGHFSGLITPAPVLIALGCTSACGCQTFPP